MREEQTEPTIIDEDGKPFVDGEQRAQRPGGIPFGAMPFGTMPTPQIPAKYLGRDGKPSLVKIMGWKGIAITVLIVAALIGLAALSFVVALIALPVVLLLGVIAWVAAKVRGGPKQPAAGHER